MLGQHKRTGRVGLVAMLGLGFGVLWGLPAYPSANQPPSNSLLSTSITAVTSLECSEILRMIGQLAELSEKFPNTTPLSLGESPALDDIIRSEWAPEWLVKLAELQKKFQPQLEFIQFADSDTLLQITALQLRSLGIRSAQGAKDFLARFPNLPADRRLSFINGLIFRLLLEIQNDLTEAENRQRLGLSPEVYARTKRLISVLRPEELPNFLMCHFAFRADSFAERLTQNWDSTAKYRALVPAEYEPWTKLHGIFISPDSGQRLYDSRDLISLVRAILPIGAHAAVTFFVEAEIQYFTISELRDLASCPNLQNRVRELLLHSEGQESSSSASSAHRQRLIRATQSELAALELAGAMQEMGGASELMKSLQGGIEQCANTVQTASCSWIYSGVQILLKWVGLSPQDWGGYILSNVLGQALVALSSNTTYADQLKGLLAAVEQGAVPIAAFAKELGAAGTSTTEVLQQRRADLRQRLVTLQGNQSLTVDMPVQSALPAPHSGP
jgi:hypothetical protein